MNQTCPCQSGKNYQDCCQPLHQNQQLADTAEQLMRSRYAAFVKHEVDYLLKTLHSSSQQPNEREQLQQTVSQTQWLGLNIVDHQQHGDEAEVEFIAFYQDGNDIAQLHENSRFVKQQGQWFYVDGEFLPAIKLNRNAPCFCGSGKKFKRCHAK